MSQEFARIRVRGGPSSVFQGAIMAMRSLRSPVKVKLMVLAFIAALLCSPRDWTKGQDRPEILGHNLSFQERIGTDDGALFVVHFIGDTHGSLEACG